MDLVQQLLLLSEKLYQTLEYVEEDKDEKRDEQINLINKLLDARGQTISKLEELGERPLHGHEKEAYLRDLNHGIIERLHTYKGRIKEDMQKLQVSMKSETRYVNPYSHLQNLDGTYFDKRE